MPMRVLSPVFVFVVSLFLTACGDGERGFVPGDRVTEEETLDISLNAAAVKGPLANVNLSFYAVDPDKGVYGKLNRAFKGWGGLVQEAGVSISDANFNLPADQNAALLEIQQGFEQFGFVTELPALQSEIETTTSISQALSVIAIYLDEDSPRETNSIIQTQLNELVSNASSLNQIKRELAQLPGLSREVNESESVSSLLSVLNRFASAEQDAAKRAGWASFLDEVNTLRAQTTAVSQLRASLSAISASVADDAAVQSDLIAIRRLEDLRDAMADANSIESAEILLDRVYREEGNAVLRTEYRSLLEGLVTLDDIKQLVDVYSDTYHFRGLSTIVASAATLQEALDNAMSSFDLALPDALDDLLVNKELDAEGKPENFLFETFAGNQSYVEGIGLGDYEGFVYLRAESGSATVDLNSGKAPVIPVLETIFSTDELRSYGDNAKEDRSLVYVLDGTDQRDDEGNLIRDTDELDLDNNTYQIYRERRYPSPLSTLALRLAIQELSSSAVFLNDRDGLVGADLSLSNENMQDILDSASETVLSSLSISAQSDVSVFGQQLLITKEIARDNAAQEQVIRNRAQQEYFAGILAQLLTQTDQSAEDLVTALAQDLSDRELDGQYYDTEISELSFIDNIPYRFSQDPQEIKIPDTDWPVTQVGELVREQILTTSSGLELTDFRADPQNIAYFPAAGGIDSDGDGVLDNSDAFPNDPLLTRDLVAGYAGLWDVQFDSSQITVVSLNGSLSLTFQEYEQELACSPAPCLSVGDSSSLIEQTWRVLESPSNGNLEISTVSDRVGFLASVTVPGDYLVKGLIVSDVAPAQTYEVIVPLRVIDPRDIVFVPNPEVPQPGQAVTLNFLVTPELCDALESIAAACLSIDFDDEIPDYLSATYLNEFLEYTWRSSEDFKALSYTQNGTTSFENFDSYYGEELAFELKFNTRDTAYNVGEFSFPVSVDSTTSADGVVFPDADQDGVSDLADAYPLDPACSAFNDGVQDTNGDGTVDAKDTPSCIDTLKPSIGLIAHSVEFKNELWEYSAQDQLIFRSDSESSAVKGALSTFSLPASITAFLNSPITSRVYLGLENGQLWYFDFGTLSFELFAELNEPAWSAPFDVQALQIIGDFLSANYGAGRYALFLESGQKATLSAGRKYPRQGEAVQLSSNGIALSRLAATFDLEWSLQRYLGANSYQEYSSQAADTSYALLTNESGFSLLAGQTQFGEVVTFELKAGSDVLMRIDYPVIGVDSFALDERYYGPNDDLFLTPAAPQLTGLAGLDYDASGFEFYVDWLVNGENQSTSLRALRTRFEPFSLPAKYTQYGDLVDAVVYLRRAGEEFELERFSRIIIGAFESFSLNPSVTEDGINSTIELNFNNANREFYDQYVRPLWYVNGELQEGVHSKVYPDEDGVGQALRWGDTLEFAFEFNFNGERIETSTLSGLEIEVTDPNLVNYEIGPRYALPGTDVGLQFNYITQAALSGYELQWYVNGILDDSVDTPDYDTVDLDIGDELRLEIRFPDTNPDDGIPADGFQVTDSSRIWIGYDDSADASQTNDQDGDGTSDFNDYFVSDAACFAASDGIPDDRDNDGISDIDEMRSVSPNKSYPNVLDSDSDGVNDFEELSAGTDPSDADSPGVSDDDLDGDGLSNLQEQALGTKVHVKDSDFDGLSDGFEFGSGGRFDPLDNDTNDDGLLDGEEYSQEQLAQKSIVTKGHCFSSWVAQRAPKSIAIGQLQQSDPSSAQRVAILDASGREVFLYNTQSEAYETSVKEVALGDVLEVLAFDVDDLTHLYAGTNSGLVHVIDASAPGIAFVSDTDHVFNTQTNDPVTAVIDQGELLLVETFSDGSYSQHIFDTNPIQSTAPVVSFSSGSSLKEYRWQDDADRRTLWYTDSDEADTLISLELDLVSPELSVRTEINVPTEHGALSAPILVENFGAPRLRFASGQRYEIDSALWESGFARFNFSMNHLGHRVSIPRSDAGLLIEYFTGAAEDTRWSFMQEVSGTVLALLPSGEDVVVLTQGESDSAYRFGRYALGDTDNDGLPGWYETYVLASSQDDESLVATDVIAELGQTYLQAFQSFENIAAYIRDSDGDGVSDAAEACPLCIVKSDQDADGLLDGDEAMFGPGVYAFNVRDTDGNNVNDGDEDFDGDGISNREELYVYQGTDPTLADTDGDGLNDYQELFITLTNPGSSDTDANSISDANEDFDLDGLNNSIEVQVGTDPYAADTDGDGLSDAVEIAYDGVPNAYDPANDLNPLTPDTDADGISDAIEVGETSFNPLVDDSGLDPDGDGLINLYEALIGSNPQVGNSDTDGDGLSDLEEFDLGTSAVEADSDGDGLNDNLETSANGDSNPLLYDTDRDGLSDGEELAFSGAADVFDVSTDLRPNVFDTDNDGLSDGYEVTYLYVYSEDDLEVSLFPAGRPSIALNPLLTDTDGDAIDDQREVEVLGTNPAEIDTDNDGLSDQEEVSLGTSPLLVDTDNDGIPDGFEVLVLQTSPLDRDSNDNGVDDGAEDADLDGLSNADEINIVLTNPIVADSDGWLQHVNGQLIFVDDVSDPLDALNILEMRLDGAVIHDELLVKILGARDFDNGNLIDENSQVLVAANAFIIEADNGLSDAEEDPDRDGLTNAQEIALGTNPYNYDSDGDGLIDSLEVDGGQANSPDFDEDGLSDGQEVALGTDPANPDTDGDGLEDGREVDLGTDPLGQDSDGDFLPDGQDDELASALVADFDEDGILDGIEVRFLGTDPDNLDSDSDGIPDGVEAWVFAIEPEDTSLPENERTVTEVPGFNSRGDIPGWDGDRINDDLLADESALVTNATHRRTTLRVRVAPASDTPEPGDDGVDCSVSQGQVSPCREVDLYARLISNPAVEDSDGDGLSDYHELIQVESNRSVFSYLEALEPEVCVDDPGTEEDECLDPKPDCSTNFDVSAVISPNSTNGNRFCLADPMNINTSEEAPFGTSVGDGEEDFDRDRLININDLSEIEDAVITIITRDSDSDGLWDGIERLLLGTDPLEVDSDEDGITDLAELSQDPSISERPIDVSESCLPAEVVISNVAEASYCYTLEFLSYPDKADSDLDGAGDAADIYPLDQTCYRLEDGFDDGVLRSCYASWVAGQGAVELVEHINSLVPANNEIALFSPGWDKVVRYDYRASAQRYLDHIDGVSGVIDMAYSSLGQRLYLLESSGALAYVDLASYTSGDALNYLGNATPAGIAEALVVAESATESVLLVQSLDGNQRDLTMYDNAGLVTDVLTNVQIDTANNAWVASSNRLYAPVRLATQTEADSLAYVELNTTSASFVGGIVESTAFASVPPDRDLSGVVSALDGDTELALGAGYLVSADLDTQMAFAFLYRNEPFTSFGEILDFADHFITSVRFDVLTESENLALEPSALLVGETGKNVYLLKPQSADERIISVVPRGLNESVYVLKTTDNLSFKALGLSDTDADGMNDLYENYYGLDAGNDDVFLDPDQDFLSNIEEFEAGTDPNVADTDGDSWDDGYEVFNNTDPLDALSF